MRSSYLAESYPLARGWHRQLDRKVNPLFYDAKHELTSAEYEAWLRDNAVRWVALPDAPLDFSARAERELLEEGQPYLEPVHESAKWRIWEVRDALPPVEGPAKLIAAGADGFDLQATGTGEVLVRQHGTPYWEVVAGDACVSEDPSGWTRVQVERPGLISVRARFSAVGALRREPRCADDDRPLRTSAVSPPVTKR